jgi:hypothetical protein
MCDCNKPKPQAHGSKPRPAGGTPAGGLASQTQSFTLTTTSGRTQTFTGSLLEVQAAAVRLGGATISPK